MGILDLFGNGSKKDYEKLGERLDDLEDILHELNLKADDRFETVLSGVEMVIPHEKGQFINRLEERLVTVKRDMILAAVLSECSGEPKSYPEIRKGVANRTSLNFSRAFLDSCLRRLGYEAKLDRIGSRFITVKKSAGLLDKLDEHAIAADIAPNGPEERVPPFPSPIPPRVAVPVGEAEIASPKPAPAPAAKPVAVQVGKLEKLERLLRLVADLERQCGTVPVEAVIKDSWKYGLEAKEANDLLDEHLMVTGQLYEPREGHVKRVRPL